MVILGIVGVVLLLFLGLPTLAELYVDLRISEIRVGKKSVPVPNEQLAFPDLPEGTVLEFVGGGEKINASVINYEPHGKRLCLYYRRHVDATRTGG